MKTFFICLLIILFNTKTSHADTITLAADIWCPINCNNTASDEGFMIEIARLIFEKEGHKIEYRIIPWARAILEAEKGKINAVVGAFRGDVPHFIFPSVPQYNISPSSLFVRADDKWHYKNTASLENVSLAAILGYDYGEFLNVYIKKHKSTDKVQIITGNNPLQRNLLKLIKKRVDVVVDAEPVLRYKADQMGISNQIRLEATLTKATPCYIAFSPTHKKSHTYANILSEGMTKLKRSEQLKQILRKYSLKEKI